MIPKILVVDDEESIVKLITYNLERAGFQTIAAHDGQQALALVKREKPDLIVLDVMLPELDGLSVCRSLRQDNISTPILILTARDDEIDKVLGLEMGADDYLTKPFSIRELVARIKAILRRAGPGTTDNFTPSHQLRVGELLVDIERHEVYINGRHVDLTPKEYELLVYLMRNKDRALTRELLLDQLWGYDYFGDTRTVDVHVRHLREKIEVDARNPQYIVTVRGVGYKFKEPLS